ncbi:3-methyl-2-oxobutanoate hydroxymethyltransferase [Diplonema papillatum]|nr:3-methyl-2-oxobutanoate hydroxymethyltransferase [Diplonema papillatum]
MITGIRRGVRSPALEQCKQSAIREMAEKQRPASGGGVVRPSVECGGGGGGACNPLTVPAFSPALHKAKRYYSTPPREPGAAPGKPRRKTTILDINKRYREDVPLTQLTCYDYPTASIVSNAGVDMLLVGDSVGMVVHGHTSTVPVTMAQMITHCQSVRRGAPASFIIGDMPFGSYEVAPHLAVKSAVQLIKEGNVDAVKLEGGARMARTAAAIVNAGILVQGHIGLTPQTAASLGGFRVQGKTAEAAQALLHDAQALQRAGCFSIVIEGVPAEVAAHITKQLSVPTIGIGSGKHTSGQVLVLHDMLGLTPEGSTAPKFVKKYADIGAVMRTAVQAYCSDVQSRAFPCKEHTYAMASEEVAKLDHMMLTHDAPPRETPAAATPLDRTRLGVKEDGSKARKVAVIGGGAMGSFVAGSLARQGGNTVWLVSAWTDHVDAISTKGLRVDSLDGGTRFVDVIRATHDVNTILESDGLMDVVIILVKSPNTEPAARLAAELVHPDHGHIVTLQNGVGNRDIILKSFDVPERVIHGVTAHGALMVGSGHVQHTGKGTTTLALPADIASVQRSVSDIAAMFSAAGIVTNVGRADAMEGMIWGKLIINAGINPLSALFRVKNGVLAENAVCRDLLEKTVAEAANVASRKRVKLPFSNPIETALAVARNTAANQSSMLCDVLRGVQTEIDVINGAIVREGHGLGVSVDTNAQLVSMIQANQRLACI